MPKSRNKEIVGTIDFNGAETDFCGQISYTIDNDGIGPYEFWGQKCYDKGRSYVSEIILEYLILDNGEKVKSGAFFDAVEKHIKLNFDNYETECFESYSDAWLDRDDV